MDKLRVSERRACKVLNISRTTKRDVPRDNPFKEKLRERVIYFAKLYGRYGYRKVAGLLNFEGWDVGKDAVFTIWREDFKSLLKCQKGVVSGLMTDLA